MSERTKYVLGFAFDFNARNVVLISKLRPTWQAGYLNGVGGHVEDADEDTSVAMSREFHEETGVVIPAFCWEQFAVIRQPKGTCAVFRAFRENISDVRTTTDEEVVVCSLPLAAGPNMQNLDYLIPLALDPSVDAELKYA